MLLFPALTEAAEPLQEPQYVICPASVDENTNTGVVSLVGEVTGVTTARTGADESPVVKPLVEVH